jgi:ADP-L-glycero-D-manno-heptose 6-epimerase
VSVFRALGKEPNIEYIDMPEGLEKRYQYYTAASPHKLKAAGFDSQFLSLEEAVRDYVVNYLEKDPRGEEEP